MFNPFKRKERYPCEWLIALLSGCAVEKSFVDTLYKILPSETVNALGRHDPIESRVLDLWLVIKGFIAASQHLSQPQQRSILDEFHLEAYRSLMKRGKMTQAQIMDLQGRLQQRYREYYESYPSLFSTPPSFDFVHAIVRNLFGHTAFIPDPVIIFAIISCVTGTLQASSQVFKESLPKVQL